MSVPTSLSHRSSTVFRKIHESQFRNCNVFAFISEVEKELEKTGPTSKKSRAHSTDSNEGRHSAGKKRRAYSTYSYEDIVQVTRVGLITLIVMKT